VISIANQYVVQSVDQFRAMLDDPYNLGRVAALHALNDLYAMQASAHSAQALVTLPFAAAAVQQRDLLQVMSGALIEFNRVGCALIGGHTGEGIEMMLGFSVNGLLDANENALPVSLRAGDDLILTKPIGSGVILAAQMQGLVGGVAVRECVRSMLVDQQPALAVFQRRDVSALTDVTGFGLLGHLARLLSDAQLGCELDCSAIPLLPDALTLSRQGVTSSLLAANRHVESGVKVSQHLESALVQLLSDPQTSGGLLVGVNATQSSECVAELRAAGYTSACVIGRIGGHELELR